MSSSTSSSPSTPSSNESEMLVPSCNLSVCSEPADGAITARKEKKGGLGVKDFRLVRKIGGGDVGSVYLCRLRGSECLFAMKVVDKEAMACKKKVKRVEMEKLVLKMLDHPFLPRLYADFEVSNFECMVMEYCEGGDLYSVRHRQKEGKKRFDLRAARFYSAEVLLALEYLHMLGIVYRDLKPENVLLRSNGHIMLTDFDLSLKSNKPTIPSLHQTLPKNQTTCFPFWRIFRSHSQNNRPVFTAEPTEIRSCSFVGTHEYVSPEVAAGGCHGNAVDWWAFGIFLYELIYGRTPFSGENNKTTLKNIVQKPLQFPPASSPEYSLESDAKSLISALLVKEPSRRLGSKFGAAEIKSHRFFRGLNFALIRSAQPPELGCSGANMEKPAKFDFF